MVTAKTNFEQLFQSEGVKLIVINLAYIIYIYIYIYFLRRAAAFGFYKIFFSIEFGENVEQIYPIYTNNSNLNNYSV